MPLTSPAPARAIRLSRSLALRREATRSFGDDQIFSKLHSVGIQAALSVLLSLFGLGSAMAQSIDPETSLAGNTQATRDRVISEIRQAREDGTIKRWSPILVEFPPKAPLKGSRFAPYATRQIDRDGDRLVPIGAGEPPSGIATAGPRAER